MLAAMSRTAFAPTALTLFLLCGSTASAQFYNPCPQPVAVANPCPCLQPVTETVYREVPVTRYRTVQRTVRKPVVRTEYEDREITAYRQVWDQRTAEVPTVNYQNVTECRQVTMNQSYWQTHWDPVPKVSPCEYDPSPTFLGAMNRMSYSLRMAMTPNYIPRREFVPNVVAYNVPVTRTVAVPSTRQVTYNVARWEPYTTTQRVAVQKLDYVEDVVTAYEPYTEMQTVAVGTQTRYAYVDPSGGSATASGPTPARSAEGDSVPRRSAEGGEGATPRSSDSDDGDTFRPLSYPQPAAPQSHPNYLETRRSGEAAGAAPASVPSAVRVAGWRPSRAGSRAAAGPRLSVAAN